ESESCAASASRDTFGAGKPRSRHIPCEIESASLRRLSAPDPQTNIKRLLSEEDLERGAERPMALAAVSLDDKYTLEQGRIYLSGIQALVRLPLMQRRRDLAAGLNTAGFISGYRGSPLGGLDQNLWHAERFLEQPHIRFQPGVNEDLAATAV